MSDVEQSTPEVSSLSRIPFSKEDEADIEALAWWLRASGIVTAVTVIFGVAEMVRTTNFSNVIGLMIMMACAVLSIQAASHFHKVATTDVADQDHILGGFRKLRLAYLLLSIWIIIGLVFICAVLLFVLVYAIVSAAR